MEDGLQTGEPTLWQCYEQIMIFLVKDGPHAELAKEYLRGNIRIAELYPYADEFRGGFISHVYSTKLKKYHNDTEFFDRCKALMVLACSAHVTVSECGEDVLQGVENFFRMLDRQQMDIAHQLGGYVAAREACVSSCSLDALVEGAVSAFTRYLQERREETVAAFWGAKAEGRQLALFVMRKDPAQNKEEILRYASDSARIVREELLDILYVQKDWLDAVKVLLCAKKAPQRELAVQVLAHWQQEGGDHKELLLQALEKEKSAKVRELLRRVLGI